MVCYSQFYPLSPYLYFIVDNRSGAILLMGRYCGREQNENILSWVINLKWGVIDIFLEIIILITIKT